MSTHFLHPVDAVEFCNKHPLREFTRVYQSSTVGCGMSRLSPITITPQAAYFKLLRFTHLCPRRFTSVGMVTETLS